MTSPCPPSANDRAGRYGDGREEAESSEDGNTPETEVEGEGGIFEDLGWKVMMMEGI